MNRLKGKIAVVTGGGSGIGRSICIRFAEEGAAVAVLDRDEAAAAETVSHITAAGLTATAYPCDVGEQDSVVAAIRAAEQDHGPVDVLVNNAGIAHVGNLEQTAPEDMDRLYAVNVKGVYNGMRACVPSMVARGGGVILNLASIASKIGIADRFAYSMTKGAVLTMTLSVARDYVEKGIRCNCICPARVHTPFVDNFITRNYAGQEDEVFQRLNAYQPIGRMGAPEEIAALAAFLCSDEAAFITAAAYDIDGGVMGLR